MAENGVRFLSGQWNSICDVCGQKYKSGDMKKRWDGLMVCPRDWEPRHPQDFLRGVPDRQNIPWARPRPEDVFVPSTRDVTLIDVVAVLEEALSTAATYVRYIPHSSPRQILPPVERALNNQVLNWGTLNGADSAIPNTDETVMLSEELQMEASLHISESLSVSETIQTFLGTLLTDSLDIMEEVSAYIISTNPVLNGAALNRGPLG